MGLVERQPEQVVVGEQPAHVLGELAAGVDRRRARRHARGDDLADDVAKREVILGQPVQRDDVRRGRRHRLASATERAGAYS